jgi:histidine triad (HIT) family protein
MKSDCVLCKISRGQIPSQRIHEDDLTVAFLAVDQVNPGHTIVAIKPHLETIADLSLDQAAAAFRAVNRVARAVDRAFRPAGLMIIQRSGIVSGQTIPHFHLHVLPRIANDGLTFTWPPRNLPADELAGLASQIRATWGHDAPGAIAAPDGTLTLCERQAGQARESAGTTLGAAYGLRYERSVDSSGTISSRSLSRETRVRQGAGWRVPCWGPRDPAEP